MIFVFSFACIVSALNFSTILGGSNWIHMFMVVGTF